MAVTHTEIQVTWDSGSDTNSLAAAAAEASDTEVFNTAAVDAMITCKADNGSTPVAGDTVDFYALYSTGDPDGASTAEFDTTTQGEFLCTVDTFADDPAIRTVPLRTAASEFQVYAVNNGASTVTVSAGWVEVRA